MSNNLVLIGTAVDVNTETISEEQIAEMSKFEFTAKNDDHIKVGHYGIPFGVEEIINSRLNGGKDGKSLTWYQHNDDTAPSVAKFINVDYKQMQAIRKSDEWVDAVNNWVSEAKEDEQEVRREQADKILLKMSKSSGVTRGPNGAKKGANPAEVIDAHMVKAETAISKLVENNDIPADNSELADELGRKIHGWSVKLIKAVKAPSEKARVEAQKAEEERRKEEERLAKLEADAAKLSDVESELAAAKDAARKVMKNPKATKDELLAAMKIIAS